MAEQPEPLVVFVDRSLGRHDVPDALRHLGANVELHDDHFAPNVPDVEWLTVVGKKGWVVLTKDQRIHRNPLELGALISARVRAFVLAGKNLTGSDMATILARRWKRIAHEAMHRPAPFVVIVSRLHVRVLPVRGPPP